MPYTDNRLYCVVKIATGLLEADKTYRIGLVTGEFGFIEAMAMKKQETSAWLNSESDNVRIFAETYCASLERKIIDERTRAIEGIALRKAQYRQYD